MAASFIFASDGESQAKDEVTGDRRTWRTLWACTVSAVSSVILKLCSNSTVEVEHKAKEHHTGKSSRWRFVIHDTEEVTVT